MPGRRLKSDTDLSHRGVADLFAARVHAAFYAWAPPTTRPPLPTRRENRVAIGLGEEGGTLAGILEQGDGVCVVVCPGPGPLRVQKKPMMRNPPDPVYSSQNPSRESQRCYISAKAFAGPGPKTHGGCGSSVRPSLDADPLNRSKLVAFHTIRPEYPSSPEWAPKSSSPRFLTQSDRDELRGARLQPIDRWCAGQSRYR